MPASTGPASHRRAPIRSPHEHGTPRCVAPHRGTTGVHLRWFGLPSRRGGVFPSRSVHPVAVGRVRVAPDVPDVPATVARLAARMAPTRNAHALATPARLMGTVPAERGGNGMVPAPPPLGSRDAGTGVILAVRFAHAVNAWRADLGHEVDASMLDTPGTATIVLHVVRSSLHPLASPSRAPHSHSRSSRAPLADTPPASLRTPTVRRDPRRSGRQVRAMVRDPRRAPSQPMSPRPTPGARRPKIANRPRPTRDATRESRIVHTTTAPARSVPSTVATDPHRVRTPMPVTATRPTRTLEAPHRRAGSARRSTNRHDGRGRRARTSLPPRFALPVTACGTMVDTHQPARPLQVADTVRHAVTARGPAGWAPRNALRTTPRRAARGVRVQAGHAANESSA